LQRAVTDFGTDVSFAQAMDKLVEHYGVILSESTITRITQHHAQRMLETQKANSDWPEQIGCAAVIAEMDGGMVPIVETDENRLDKRKGKTLSWKEAKLCLAHASGNYTPVYGGTLQGDVAETGKQLFACALEAGFGRKSRLHAVGDGAPLDCRPSEDQFGANGSYLIDFCHVCEYLNAAAQAIMAKSQVQAWMEEQKECLKRQGL
jgi:hypothetical protein